MDDNNESTHPVRIVNACDIHQLKVKNADKTDICLIKTDKCLFTDEHKKCDCILFNKNKFFLVEISECSTGNKGNKRDKAIKQLGDTIEMLQESGIDLSDYESTAIICFKSGKTRPIQTSFTTKQALFNEQYKIKLGETNFISF